MTIPEASDESLAALIEWFDSYRPASGEDPNTYVICAGLAVLERMRSSFPLRQEDYLTPGNQVRTGGPFIQSILNRHGVDRRFTREGGRTTRATVPAARSLVSILTGMKSIAASTQGARLQIIDHLQSWLVDRVRDFFARQKIAIEVNLRKPSAQIVADIVEAAEDRGGAVAQHLVGAKLAIRFPNLEVENFSYTTADQQLGRQGDFIVGDTAFHVTVSPVPAVLEKCKDNLRSGFRTLLLVPENRLQAAQQMAESSGVQEEAGVAPIELFVGQNIEELSEFDKLKLAASFRKLLEKYNERVSQVEIDQSLMFEIPENL